MKASEKWFGQKLDTVSPSVEKPQAPKVHAADVLAFGINREQPTVEEARAAMLKAKQAPSGIEAESAKNASLDGVTTRETTETAQDGYEWIAQVQFLNPNGTAADGIEITGATQTEVRAELDSILQARMAERKPTRNLIKIDTRPKAEEPVRPVDQTVTVTAEPSEKVEESVVVVEDEPEIVEQFENESFTARIFQEDGQWVAQLDYKNGAGAERFVAKTRKALDMELLKGKGHATLRVRAAVQREKLGGVDYDEDLPLPDDITEEVWKEMSEAEQLRNLRTVVAQQVLLFRDQALDYIKSDKNNAALQGFLKRINKPLTSKNLLRAWEDLKLTAPELLDLLPQPAVETPKKSVPARTTTAKAEDSPSVTKAAAVASATAPATATPSVVVRKRGTTGLRPQDSSAVDETLNQPAPVDKPREPSEAELRTMPLSELRKKWKGTLKTSIPSSRY